MSAISDLARTRSLFAALVAGGGVFDPLTMAAMAMTAVGTGVSAAGTIAAGQNAQQLGIFQQQEETQQAEGDVATAQRKMLDEQRKGVMVQSQLQARGAGSGLTTSLGSIAGLSSQIAGRSTYNSLMDLSEGENAAAGLTNIGDADRYQGDLTNSLAPLTAAGTIASGAGSMFMAASKNPSAFGLGGSPGAGAGMGPDGNPLYG